MTTPNDAMKWNELLKRQLDAAISTGRYQSYFDFGKKTQIKVYSFVNQKAFVSRDTYEKLLKFLPELEGTLEFTGTGLGSREEHPRVLTPKGRAMIEEPAGAAAATLPVTTYQQSEASTLIALGAMLVKDPALLSALSQVAAAGVSLPELVSALQSATQQ